MSDTTVAILILPLMTVLVLVLEYSRIGCTSLKRRLQRPRTPGGVLNRSILR